MVLEEFTDDERAILSRHMTSTDGAVFCLVNLPETVKGALFARYSRYSGTLRRLFLDEFAPSLPDQMPSWDRAEGDRAKQLYDTVFLGYGDDSVAQLGSVHVGIEWCSQLLTKIVQRHRLASYLEQSTRYIAFDRPDPLLGRYRYHDDPRFGPGYTRAMDELFTAYGDLRIRMEVALADRFPRADEEPEGAWRRAIAAKALDSVRGLLPIGTYTHTGMVASGQTYEQLVMHLLAHPLQEAQDYGRLLLAELDQVIPSFLTRVHRPERGGVWVEQLRERRAAADRVVRRLGMEAVEADGPAVRLVHADADPWELLSGLLYEQSGQAEDPARLRDLLSAVDRDAAIAELVGERENRRHRPGRGLERSTYRFEIVSDYGAFRDMQRHRLLTVAWQQPHPAHGLVLPEEIEEAGLAGDFERAWATGVAAHDELMGRGLEHEAAYALPMATRLRYTMEMNAREALHVCELRSGAQGHPAYRAVAIAMADAILTESPHLHAAFQHVDRESDPRLERLQAEIRNEQT